MTHYYDEIQDSQLRIFTIKAKIFNKEFKFYSAPGVFSKKDIDRGTLLLIHSAIVMEKWKILDFGCGYGAIGIILARKFPHAEITMVDVNRRAVQLAKMNIAENRIKNATAYFSNFFEQVNEKFNVIVVNPPQVAGKDACFKIIKESKKYLLSHGLLQLVARHNKGGLVLSKKMKDVFGNVREIAKKAGYRVYVSKKEAQNNS